MKSFQFAGIDKRRQVPKPLCPRDWRGLRNGHRLVWIEPLCKLGEDGRHLVSQPADRAASR